jgi:hypothetical protein
MRPCSLGTLATVRPIVPFLDDRHDVCEGAYCTIPTRQLCVWRSLLYHPYHTMMCVKEPTVPSLPDNDVCEGAYCTIPTRQWCVWRSLLYHPYQTMMCVKEPTVPSLPDNVCEGAYCTIPTRQWCVWSSMWNKIWWGTKHLEATCSSITLSTTNPTFLTWDRTQATIVEVSDYSMLIIYMSYTVPKTMLTWTWMVRRYETVKPCIIWTMNGQTEICPLCFHYINSYTTLLSKNVSHLPKPSVHSILSFTGIYWILITLKYWQLQHFYYLLQSANTYGISKCLFSVLSSCMWRHVDNLCGLVVRVPGCRPRGPGFDSQCYQIVWVAVGLERGPLSPCEGK